MLADGRLHLSAIARVGPHLTPENRDDLLRRATHKSKREIDELVAEIAPRPDVPAAIRKLPAGRFVARPASDRFGFAGAAGRADMEVRPERGDSNRLDAVGDSGRGRSAEAVGRSQPDGLPGLESPRENHRSSETRPPWVPARPRPAVIEPLAPSRYEVQFTASPKLRDKIERLQALMRSSIPDGDLAAVIEAAVTEKSTLIQPRRCRSA